MKRPVVIVDPRSSGIELAPAFRARGVTSIAVTLPTIKNRQGYGTEIRANDFIDVIPANANLVDQIKEFDPIAIIPGAEAGIPIAEALTAALTPHLANDGTKIKSRFHKAFMQQALEASNVPALKTLNATSIEEVDAWLSEYDLKNSSLVIKPPVSAGSSNVLHVQKNGDWKRPFQFVLREQSNITGNKNETVVVQEKAEGTEFAVGTVSVNGKHFLAHLIQYNKMRYNDRDTVYDHVEFVAFDQNLHGEIFEYTKQALDALGVRWGAAHNEIMLTPKGPRLIESVPRMCGGPVVEFSREATDSSQADKLVELYLNGEVTIKDYHIKKSVMPVFLKSPRRGILANVEVLEKLKFLPNFFKTYFWFKNGDEVPETVDYLTSIGIVALSGSRETLRSDYETIRQLENELVVQAYED